MANQETIWTLTQIEKEIKKLIDFQEKDLKGYKYPESRMCEVALYTANGILGLVEHYKGEKITP